MYEGVNYTIEGKHDVYYWSKDIAGNMEDVKHLTFFLDTLAPKCPKVGSSYSMPNAYAFRSDGIPPNTHRNNAFLTYVKQGSGYDQAQIPTDNQMIINTRQNDTNPYFFWPRTEDLGVVSGSEGIDYSGLVEYAYLWEKAEDDDFFPNGAVKATAPSSSIPFSVYKSIDNFDAGNDTDAVILEAHEGALMPYQVAGSNVDDIPDPVILASDDGETFFLWLKVRDSAGNENKCGQISSPDNGTGPGYVYRYGAALRFTTPELFDDHPLDIRYLNLSEDKSNPTRFAAGPFIAGDEISFDKLYYSYNHATSAGDAQIFDAGAGSYYMSDVVFLVNYDNELSEGEPFALKREDNSPTEPDYPSTKITESLNFFRGEFADEFSHDYFFLSSDFKANTVDDSPANTLEQENDFFLGASPDGITNIITGSDSVIHTEPILLNISNVDDTFAGRLLNLGILNGPRSTTSPYNVIENLVKIDYTDNSNTPHTGVNRNLIVDPLSEFSDATDIEISRGYTNVAGRYQVRLAMQTTETTTQYFEVNFDILPNEPNFNCDDGECSDLILTKPEDN